MAVEQNARAPVLDLSRQGAVTVEIEVAEAAEVLMSICAVADRADHDTFDLGAEWLQARLETLPNDVREEVEALRLGDMKVAAHLLGIVYETPKPRRFAAFMERLEQTDPVELKLHLFGHYDTSTNHIAPEIVEGAARGEAPAIEQVLEALAEWSDKHELYRDLLQMDGLEVKTRIVDLLPRWYEHVFAPCEQEWREAAERDADAKRALYREIEGGLQEAGIPKQDVFIVLKEIPMENWGLRGGVAGQPRMAFPPLGELHAEQRVIG